MKRFAQIALFIIALAVGAWIGTLDIPWEVGLPLCIANGLAAGCVLCWIGPEAR